MRVEVWSDVVCPWCYIGAARLEKAIADFEYRADVEVVYRSFELDPGRAPSDVEPLAAMLQAKYGPGAAEMEAKVAGLAAAEGLGYRSDRLVGGTLDAHRLLQFARSHDVQAELLARLFRANFADADSIFSADALVTLAAEVGLDPGNARTVLADPNSYLDEVRSDEAQAGEFGARGVPFFVFDRRFAVSGAQSVEVLGEALERISRPA